MTALQMHIVLGTFMDAAQFLGLYVVFKLIERINTRKP